MPTIDVAMARSLRGGVWGSVASSIAANIETRGITDTVNNAGNQINDVKTALSSWDNCMAVTYCNGAAAPPQYAEFEVSKSGANPADADALPAMPSWEGAGSKKVSLTEEVELEQMKPAASPNFNAQNMPLMAPNAMSHPNSPMPGDRSPYGQNAQAGSSGYFANANQPANPYATGVQGPGDYNDSTYGQSTSPFGVDQAYGTGAMAAGGMAMAQGRRTPHRELNNNGYGPQRGQTYPPPQQEFDQGYGDYEQGGYGMGRPPRTGPSPAPVPRSFTAPPCNGPSPAPPGFRRSPGPQNDYRGPSAPPAEYRRSPAPQNDYGYDQQDQYHNDNYGRPQYVGGARQYSSESTRPLAPQPSYMAELPSPDLRNNGGFDFSGNSRPQQYNYNRSPSGGVQQHIEEEEDQRPPQSSGGTYPGYKAYQPTKD
ncbi:hypothetical protein CSHISOI_01407, partial [Colletotrichum shisoi]